MASSTVKFHFNLQPLITALRTYVEHYKDWTKEQKEKHWCTVVGLAQTLIPAHIRHHYCDPEEAFSSNANLKKSKLMRSLGIYNWVLRKWHLWAEGLAGLGLGQDFGIYGGRTVAACGYKNRGSARANLEALTALDEARTEIDLPALIERLHTPIQNLEDDLGIQGVKI